MRLSGAYKPFLAPALVIDAPFDVTAVARNKSTKKVLKLRRLTRIGNASVAPSLDAASFAFSGRHLEAVRRVTSCLVALAIEGHAAARALGSDVNRTEAAGLGNATSQNASGAASALTSANDTSESARKHAGLDVGPGAPEVASASKSRKEENISKPISLERALAILADLVAAYPAVAEIMVEAPAGNAPSVQVFPSDLNNVQTDKHVLTPSLPPLPFPLTRLTRKHAIPGSEVPAYTFVSFLVHSVLGSVRRSESQCQVVNAPTSCTLSIITLLTLARSFFVCQRQLAMRREAQASARLLLSLCRASVKATASVARVLVDAIEARPSGTLGIVQSISGASQAIFTLSTWGSVIQGLLAPKSDVHKGRRAIR